MMTLTARIVRASVLLAALGSNAACSSPSSDGAASAGTGGMSGDDCVLGCKKLDALNCSETVPGVCETKCSSVGPSSPCKAEWDAAWACARTADAACEASGLAVVQGCNSQTKAYAVCAQGVGGAGN
jgi:hypothetical protein